MTLTEQAVAILDKGERQAIAVFQNRSDNTQRTERIRLGRHETYGALIMQHGRKRYGTPVNHFDYLIDIRPINRHSIDPAIKWEKQIKKAVFMLEGSGFWPEILAELKLSLEIGYTKMLTVQKIYRAYAFVEHARMTREVKALEPRLIREQDGREYVSTDVIEHWLDPKIKTMYFGKSNQEWKLQEIAAGLKEKKAVHFRVEANYDVSFEYNPVLNKAWYSEEFRGCGNGHYYLALNGTHAIYYEDD